MNKDRFKFRVWDKFMQGYVKENLGEKYVWIEDDGQLGAGIDDDSCILEQCTGLKDKNGNLIYEGDIVRFEIVDADSALGKTFERICEICFGKGDYPYSFVCKNDAYCRGYALLSSILGQEIESIEIIGNIHKQKD